MNISMTAVAAIAGLGAFALLAGAHNGADAKPQDSTSAATPAATTATQGMTVVRDAETGTLRAPNAREARRYALNDASQSAAGQADGNRIEYRADGSMTARLDESHMTYSTVTRREDGTWERHCGMDHDHALHAVPVREVQ